MNLELLTINNFYNNPYEVRKDALSSSFEKQGNYPGVRTEPYLNNSIKNTIEQILYPYVGKITNF